MRIGQNILKAELKRRRITYAQLAEKLEPFEAKENEHNLANKISRGSFTAAFFMMWMDAIGVRQVSSEAYSLSQRETKSQMPQRLQYPRRSNQYQSHNGERLGVRFEL